MLKRIVISVALASLAGGIHAQRGGAASARPEVAAGAQAEAQAARTQVQATEPAPAEPTTTATGQPVVQKKGPTPYQFQAAPYFGFSFGPRNTYTGLPAVNKGIAAIASAGVAVMLTDKAYLAGELFIYDNVNLRNFPVGIANVKSSWTYGFDAIPGFFITKCILGYMRFGVSSTRYRNHTIRDLVAWRLGVGAQATLTGNWDMRTEYIYNNFRSSAIGTPQTDQFNLGILYKFL